MLSFFGPIGIYLLGTIVLGILIRCLTLLLDIQARLKQITKEPDYVRETYHMYIKARKDNTESSI
jgi:hypothetical protein